MVSEVRDIYQTALSLTGIKNRDIWLKMKVLVSKISICAELAGAA